MFWIKNNTSSTSPWTINYIYIFQNTAIKFLELPKVLWKQQPKQGSVQGLRAVAMTKFQNMKGISDLLIWCATSTCFTHMSLLFAYRGVWKLAVKLYWDSDFAKKEIVMCLSQTLQCPITTAKALVSSTGKGIFIIKL